MTFAPLRIKLPHQFGIGVESFGVATSSTRCPRHSPSAPRKVGSPLSALMPAPVSTNTRSCDVNGWVIVLLKCRLLATLELLVEKRDRSSADDATTAPGYLILPRFYILSGSVAIGFRVREPGSHPSGRQGIYNLYIRYAKAEATGRGSRPGSFSSLSTVTISNQNTALTARSWNASWMSSAAGDTCRPILIP